MALPRTDLGAEEEEEKCRGLLTFRQCQVASTRASDSALTFSGVEPRRFRAGFGEPAPQPLTFTPGPPPSRTPPPSPRRGPISGRPRGHHLPARRASDGPCAATQPGPSCQHCKMAAPASPSPSLQQSSRVSAPPDTAGPPPSCRSPALTSPARRGRARATAAATRTDSISAVSLRVAPPQPQPPD